MMSSVPQLVTRDVIFYVLYVEAKAKIADIKKNSQQKNMLQTLVSWRSDLWEYNNMKRKFINGMALYMVAEDFHLKILNQYVWCL